ncbi:tripartite tricarboxylate transporter TctB family protein [Photobacterium sp. 1_MG-2023]|uniref:tripartite tricarboxylate transporter TctB family protein n=1 Tax=Photobacterium sp. 1_MG-2023 TaxID=3062646 RepID=UPI0026E1166F|nr:tripartite tricarboxylate transporter TctB family protein [Photobacterium sp. 1_MG-2023]MDO6708653.1 tripartite tricarboxylate transporter TctB family protein [Photobacterium sp. 1_MG-2023]
MITKDHIGGLVFLCFSIAYGYYGSEIVLFPGDEFQPFHAKSLPLALAGLGIVFSVCQLLTASRSADDKLNLQGLDFVLMAKLLVLMLIFAAALEWIGFLLSTMIFLVGGYWLLGERRPKTLFLASVPFAVGFWALLTQLLDIYLAPGRLITNVFGG